MCMCAPAPSTLTQTRTHMCVHIHTHTQTLNVDPPKLISQTCDFQFQTRDTNPTLNIQAESGWGPLLYCPRAVSWVIDRGYAFNQLS